MLAAVFIIAVLRLCQKYLIEHIKAFNIARAHAENNKILGFAAGVYNLYLFTIYLKIHKVFGLGEEEILCAPYGVKRV